MKKGMLILFVTIIFLMAGSFQNCSEQPAVLSKILSSDSMSSKISLRTSICPEVSFLDDENNNFLFILDMSRSNIGGFRKETKFQGIYPYDVYYWDPGKGKDVNGKRFEAIENFINSCASSLNNKFAVIGFSKKAGQIQYDARNRPYLNCEVPVTFRSKENAIEDLNDFWKAEKSEIQYYSQWINNPYDEDSSHVSLALSWTSYSKAAECASKIINKDLIASFEEDIDNYQVLFISDGKPRDPNDICKDMTGQEKDNCYIDNPTCEKFTGQEKDDCYTKTATDPFKQSIHEVEAIRRNINMLTVAYGIDKQEDLRFLDYLTKIQKDNGRSQRLDSFENNTDVLCELISSQFGLEINSDSLMSVVLSLSQKDGLYKSDSDMDGLLDADEVTLSYDPANPRSQVRGVLDGLCEKIGGIASCNLAMEQVTCDANLLRRDGFSDCDVKIIKNHWQQLNLDDSADWDKDGVPNFIEIVKGTDPFIDDMNDDPDNDGLSTRFEIMRSKNPFEHESLSPEELPQVLIKNEFSATTTPQCSRRTRHLILEEVPSIESQSVNVGMSTEMLHRDNEHIVAIFSSRKSQNYLLLDKGMIGKYVKLNVVEQNDNWILVPSVTELTNDDLEPWDQ